MSALFPLESTALFRSLKGWILVEFDWLYIATIAAILPFAFWLALGRYGAIRLGPDGAKPDYSRGAWIAMLFAAGMGIGLVFWGVAEPIIHAASPPFGEPMGAAARAEALPRTLHHWGLHAWTMYTVLALSIAFFGYRRGLPLTLRSCFHPIFGDRIKGALGDVIDTLAVFGTLFGLATSLGLGAGSISAGLAFLFGTPHDASTQVIIIVVVTICATLSLVLGVDKGIKRLSEFNMGLAALLLAFVFVFGPTGASLDYLVEGTGGYVGSLFERSMITGASRRGRATPRSGSRGARCASARVERDRAVSGVGGRLAGVSRRRAPALRARARRSARARMDTRRGATGALARHERGSHPEHRDRHAPGTRADLGFLPIRAPLSYTMGAHRRRIVRADRRNDRRRESLSYPHWR